MCHKPKRGKMIQMESLKLSIHEHLTSVGQEMSCVLEKQQSDVCSVQINVRVFVLERLTAVEEFMCNLFQREMETLETLLERQDKLLELFNVTKDVSSEHEERSSSLVQEEPQPPHIEEEPEEEAEGSTLTLLHGKTSHSLPDQCVESSLQVKMSSPQPAWAVSVKQEPEDHMDINFLHLPVYKEEISPQRCPSPVQEQPEPPQIKEEQEELLQRAEEADGSTLIIITVKSEDDDENGETEPLASTSTQHMKTQACVEDCGTSQPTSDDRLLSSHCSECDTEDSDEWVKTREGPSDLDTHKTQNVEGQRLYLSNKLSRDLKTSTQTDSKKNFGCTVCSKTFNLKGNMKKHSMIHTGEKPLSCTVCGKRCSHMGHLKQHMRTHTGERPYTCKVCGKGCIHIGHLKDHMRTHTGEKPFICTFCGKGCSQKGELNAHIRVHTGERPFTCTVCGKSFGQRNNLNAHMRIHTGEKPFTCTVCGTCYSHRGHLNTHMRIHTGEKPFACTVCDQRFNQNYVLKRHMRTHTGEKTFSCTVCGQRFIRNDTLKRHLRTHTEGKTL